MQGDSMKSSQTKSLQYLLQQTFNIKTSLDLPVTLISYDSRYIIPDTCFIALQGHVYNGEDYIDEAIANGATSVLQQKDTFNIKYHADYNVPIITIPNLSEKVGNLAAAFYNYPSKELNLVGITGTNGKSSLVFLIANALEELEQKAAFLGTIGRGSTNNYKPCSRTTEPPVLLQKHLAELKKTKTQTVAMEVSSHAISLNRIAGCDFSCLLFTNLSPDHIDFHKDYEEYKNVKLSLFKSYPKLPIIANIDDKVGLELLNNHANERQTIGYSINGAIPDKSQYVIATKVEYSLQSTIINVNTSWGNTRIKTNLIGVFNVYNTLALLAYLLSVNYNLSQIEKITNKLKNIPGRMELFQNKNKPLVVLDYAHNGEALEGILDFLRKHALGNIICVFGCGGDRPKARRFDMGKVASNYADNIFLTQDNPRSEDINNINNDILQAIENKNKVSIIHDRKDAISQAIKSCKNTDVVLVSGKGHEQFQEIAGVKYKYSDIAAIKAALLN